MTPPLVSVAIPAYNHAPFIAQTLHSVACQSYPNLELVVVDDGSTDGTATVVERFTKERAGRFPRIEFIRQANRGVSAASNRAIAACRGEWVHLLGSDDLIYPDKVLVMQRMIEQWADPRLALVYADADFIDAEGRVLSTTRGPKRPPPGPDAAAYLWLLASNPITNPTVALRREAFLALGGFDETLPLEDWDAWLRLSVRHSIARVPQVLAAYRRHAGNTSRRQAMMFAAQWRSFARFVTQHGDLLPAAVRRRAYRRHLRSLQRWSRRHAPQLWPRIVLDRAIALLRPPQARHFEDYARLCQRLEERTPCAC